MARTCNLALKQKSHPEPDAAHMLAAVLERPRQTRVNEVKKPEPGYDEVRVRLEGCGICSSSLPVWEGRPWFQYPLAPGKPGHEGWGYIDAVGEEVHGLPMGQRVAILSHNAFAQFDLAVEEAVAPLPEALDGMPFPGEAIGCAMNIFRRSDINEEHTVAIIGAGFLGLLLTQLCATVGAKVIVLSRRQSVLEAAMQYGAHTTLSTEDLWSAITAIKKLTAQKGCERVIEVVGHQFALDLATELISEYGKLIIGAYHQDAPRKINVQQWNWRAIDVINAHERDLSSIVQGFQQGIVATLTNRISPQERMTHTLSLEDLDEGFRLPRERPDGFIKGWGML